MPLKGPKGATATQCASPLGSRHDAAVRPAASYGGWHDYFIGDTSASPKRWRGQTECMALAWRMPRSGCIFLAQMLFKHQCGVEMYVFRDQRQNSLDGSSDIEQIPV